MPFKQWLCLYPCKGYKVFRIICQPKFYVTESIQENSATVAATDIVLFMKSNYFLHL